MRKQVDDTLIVTTCKDLVDYHIQNVLVKPYLKRIVLDIKGEDDNTSFYDLMRTLKLSLFNSVECFEVCEENKHAKSIDGIVYSKDGMHLGMCPRQKRGKIVIPEGVETIETEAFKKCSISEVVLPKTMREIGYQAFTNSDLENIFVNDGLHIICEGAFASCNKLKSFDFVGSIQEICESAFYNTGLKEIILKEGIKEVRTCAFEGCDVERIDIPESMINSCKGAFINFHEVHVKEYRTDVLKGCVYGYHLKSFGPTFTLLYVGNNPPIVVPKYISIDNISRLDDIIRRTIQNVERDWNSACMLFKYGITQTCRLMTALETVKRYPESAGEAMDYLNSHPESVVKLVINNDEGKFVELLHEIKWNQNALEELMESARKRGFVNGQAYVLKMLDNDCKNKKDEDCKLKL